MYNDDVPEPFVVCDFCFETTHKSIRIDGLPYAWRRKAKLPPKWLSTCDGGHVCHDCVKEDRDEHRKNIGL